MGPISHDPVTFKANVIFNTYKLTEDIVIYEVELLRVYVFTGFRTPSFSLPRCRGFILSAFQALGQPGCNRRDQTWGRRSSMI